MRNYRVDFTKGMSAVVDPRLLGDGYAVFTDSVDLSAFAASSYRAPVFRMDAPSGTVHAFEYRGKWHFSSEHRHWDAEFIGKQERLYYTESGYVPGAGKPAMKVIDGVEARLGTPRPAAALVVSPDVLASPAGFTAEVYGVGSSFGDESLTYRLGYRTVDGLIPAGEAITVVVAKGQTVVLRWGATTLAGVTGIVIYGRTSGKEQIIDEVGPDVMTFVDDGSLAPHGEYASNLDSTDVYFYFHTFLRNVNGHIDESGPSPLSPRIDQGKVIKITRNPDLEGLFDGSTSVANAPAYKTPVTNTICGTAFREIGSKRIITTVTDHGLTAGQEVGIIPGGVSIDPETAKHVYSASIFTSDLPEPTISAFGPGSTTAPVFAPGTLLRARITAFRGADWSKIVPGIGGGVPAESLPSAEVQWTTTAAKGLIQWSYPTADADGFHVYINDLWVATIPPGTLFYEFDSVPVHPDRPIPTVNRSRSRAFYFDDDSSLLWDSGWAVTFGLYGVMAGVIETKIVQNGHGLKVGTLVGFSGYKEINGNHSVSRVGNANEFYIKVLTRDDDTLSTTRTYKVANQAYQFVDKWALYVQRGATGGVALQQGVYPISQTEVIDYKPVQGLSVTCDSSYLAATSEGDVVIEFDPPPLGMKCPTLHNEILWGIVDNAVVWSPVNRPDAFPKAYRRNFPVPPTAISPYGGAMIVLLPTGIGRFDGTDPANLSFTMTDVSDGCSDPNTVQHTAAGLMYLSPRGLMSFQAGLNSSIPITDGKLEASIFSAASSTASSRWPTWWIPPRLTAAWAKCTRDLPTADGRQRERMLDDTLPMRGVNEDIRSFYWRGKYYLYFTGDFFGRHGTIMVDTTRRNESGYPIFHVGLRPEHVHVTKRDEAFLLLRQPNGASMSIGDITDLQTCILSPDNDTTALESVGVGFTSILAELSPREGAPVPFTIRTGPISRPDPGLLKQFSAIEVNGEGRAYVMAWVDGRLAGWGTLFAQEGPKRPRRLKLKRGLRNGYTLDLFIAFQGRLTGYEVFYEMVEGSEA